MMARENHRVFKLNEYATSRGFDLRQLTDNLELDSSDIAYVTGSILDGTGDSQSDLDVYVLTSEASFERRKTAFAAERSYQQTRRDFGIIYLPVGGIETDVEYHRVQKFLDLFEALEAFDPMDPGQINKTFDSLGRFERLEALELLHRFRIAEPFANEQNFLALREKFDERKFFLWNTNHCLVQVADMQKEVFRSLTSEDHESAYLKLTRLFDALIDAFLFSSRQSLDRWKWRLPKLRALGPPALLDQYLDVQLNRGRPPQELRQTVENGLAAVPPIVVEIKSRAKLV
jgi:hypothetical protein